MKRERIAVLIGPIVVGLVSFPPPTLAAQPTRKAMESAQTDALGYRRGEKRDDDKWFEPMRLNQEGDTARSAEPFAASPPRAAPAVGPVEASAASVPSRAGASAASGIVTGAGAPAGGADARGSEAATTRPGRGIVTGLGHAAPAASHRGHAAGSRAGTRSSIVTGAGRSPAGSPVANRPLGAGIVTGAGTSVTPAIASGVGRPHAGIVTGAGGPPGHANAHGARKGSKH